MSNDIKLANVRCSYPSLFKFEQFEGTDTDKYGCTFIIPKTNKEAIAAIKKALKAAMVRAGVEKVSALKNVCFKDGDDSDAPELQGCYSLKATTKKRPKVINSRANGKAILTAEDEVIYAGCYVNAVIQGDFYCYTNYGKGVTATLLGVQFTRDGESFEGGRVAEDEDFDDFDDVNEFDENGDDF